MSVLRKIETAVTVPFFLLSWLLCSIGAAIFAGYTMARLEGQQKEELLTKMFGKGKTEKKDGVE
jgi:hypothetical protein